MHILICCIGRSRNKGQKAIEEVLNLRRMVDSYGQEIEALEAQLLAHGGITAQDSFTDLAEQLEMTRRKRKLFQDRIRRAMDALGIDERHNLQTLIKDKFLGLRMNARAVKHRLMQRLQGRKFELERIEKTYRNVMNGMSCYTSMDLYSSLH